MTLYEINAEMAKAIEELFTSVDEETGEVSEEAVARFESLQMARDEKLDNIGAIIKNLKAEVNAIKDEEASLKDRRVAKQNKIARLEDYVAGILDGKTFESARVKFGWRKSESVVVEDLDSLDDRFKIEDISYKADKKAIKEAIKAGEAVKGAYIEENNNLQVK